MPEPEDVVAVAVLLADLARVPDGDARWADLAPPTRWTCARTVEHVADTLVFYAGQVARRADRRLPLLRDGRAAPPSEQLDNVLTGAHVLARLLHDLGAERAFHPSGMADAAGWAGMAVTELLVHGVDAAAGLGTRLELPEEICRRTVDRVFPWVRDVAGAPSELLLAVTGRATVPGVPPDPDWWWQSAPLAEWDGRPRRRTSPPAWR
jgi:hypothetical protein